MPNSIPRGISFNESVLLIYENCSSLYYEKFLSSLNVKRFVIKSAEGFIATLCSHVGRAVRAFYRCLVLTPPSIHMRARHALRASLLLTP